MTSEVTDWRLKDAIEVIFEANEGQIEIFRHAIQARRMQFAEEARYKNQISIYVGDWVTLGNNITPKLLRGRRATILEIREKNFYVELHERTDKWFRFTVPHESVSKD